jgi:hypothetical protein
VAKAEEPNPPTLFPKKEGGEKPSTGLSPSPLGGGVGERSASTHSRLPALLPYIAAGLLFLIALNYARNPDLNRDLFIYRIGAVLGSRGDWPYDVPKIRALVAEQFPDPDPKFDSFVNNNGYFPPPLAIMVYIPFAMLPWGAAKIAWAVVMFGAALMVARLPGAFRAAGEPPDDPSLVWSAVGGMLVLNYVAVAIIAVGQTPLLFVGCVVAGQWFFDRGWRWAGALLWAIPFIKPHLALPLIALAWYLGGWKRALALVVVVGALNLLGATLAGGSPLKLLDYLEYVPQAHKAVVYNRAELNPQITSWNRLLFSLTKSFAGERFLIELDIVKTVAGYLVWGGLVLGRCAAGGVHPSRAWALAATAVGGMLCCQVLGYETLGLVLTIPWLRELFTAGRRWQGIAGCCLLLLQQLSRETFEPIGIDFHRSLGVLLFAILVLIGPVAPKKAQ